MKTSYTRKLPTDKQLPKLVTTGLLLMMVISFSIYQIFDQTLTAHQQDAKMASALSQKITSHGKK